MGNKIEMSASTLYALIFVIVMSVMFGVILKFANSSNKGLVDLTKTIAVSEFEQYNGSVVSGDTVMSTINKLRETKDGIKVCYLVDSTSYGAGNMSTGALDANGYLAGSCTYVSTYKVYKTSLGPSDSGYISPVKTYNAKLVFNDNGILIGVKFTGV